MLDVEREVVEAVLADWRTAPVSGRLRAALGFLEKLTLHPEAIGPEDVAPLRTAGLTPRAIEEVILVCFHFSLIDRLADAFDFYVPTETQRRKATRLIRRLGYALTSLPG